MIAWRLRAHTEPTSETVKPDAARNGSLIRRVESIAKPAGPAAASPVFVCPEARERRFAMPTLAIVLAAMIVVGVLLVTSTVKIVQE